MDKYQRKPFCQETFRHMEWKEQVKQNVTEMKDYCKEM